MMHGAHNVKYMNVLLSRFDPRAFQFEPSRYTDYVFRLPLNVARNRIHLGITDQWTC